MDSHVGIIRSYPQTFTGTKVAQGTIISPPPNVKCSTMQSEVPFPGNSQTQTHPPDFQMEKHDLSLQRFVTPENTSPLV